jgi:xanthine dehydrogenase YagT iron-sulfur-binding subunit
MPEKRVQVTRRDVLRAGAGAAALLGVAGTQASAQDAKLPAGVKRLGRGAVPVKLTINSKATTLHLEPRVTLLDALRDRVGLTGSKRICDRGACGGCTVLLDGKPVNSCMMLAIDASGRSIRTVEGLEKGGELHPIQDAFIECDALQCGFCTSGMLMSCTALLESGAKPTDATIREAISGNLCRCGTYPHIMAACKKAAAK